MSSASNFSGNAHELKGQAMAVGEVAMADRARRTRRTTVEVEENARYWNSIKGLGTVPHSGNWLGLARTGKNWLELARNWQRLATNRLELAAIGENWQRLAKIGSRLTGFGRGH